MRAIFNSIFPDLENLIKACVTLVPDNAESTVNDYYVKKGNADLSAILPNPLDLNDIDTLIVQANKVRKLLKNANASDLDFSAVYGSIIIVLKDIINPSKLNTPGTTIFNIGAGQSSLQTNVKRLLSQLENSRSIYEKDMVRKKPLSDAEREVKRKQKEKEFEAAIERRLAAGATINDPAVGRLRAELQYQHANPTHVAATPGSSLPATRASSPTRMNGGYARPASGYATYVPQPFFGASGYGSFPGLPGYPQAGMFNAAAQRIPAPAAAPAAKTENDKTYITEKFDADTYKLLEIFSRLTKVEAVKDTAYEILSTFIKTCDQPIAMGCIGQLKQRDQQRQEAQAIIAELEAYLPTYNNGHAQRVIAWKAKEAAILGDQNFRTPDSQITFRWKSFLLHPDATVVWEKTLFPVFPNLAAIVNELTDKMFAATKITDKFTQEKKVEQLAKTKAQDAELLQPKAPPAAAPKR